jgi:hypothetical protein
LYTYKHYGFGGFGLQKFKPGPHPSVNLRFQCTLKLILFFDLLKEILYELFKQDAVHISDKLLALGRIVADDNWDSTLSGDELKLKRGFRGGMDGFGSGRIPGDR